MKYAVMTLVGGLFTLGGCAHQHVVAVDAVEAFAPDAVVVVASAEPVEHSSVWAGVLGELLVAYERAQADNASAEIPRLVAGDWLAVQCAMAGGYWDVPVNKDAPVFAGAPESWSALD